MALSSADYRLRISYQVPSLTTRPFENVWYFKRTSGAGQAPILVNGFVEDFIPAYERILPTSVNVSATIFAENLFNVDDFHETSTPLQGVITATDFDSSFVAAGFQIIRGTRQNKRHGSKRIGPLDDNSTDGNQPVASFSTALNSTASDFTDGIDFSGSTFAVCVPQSILVSNPNPPPDEIYEIQNLFEAAGVAFRAITSQVSRKGS